MSEIEDVTEVTAEQRAAAGGEPPSEVRERAAVLAQEIDEHQYRYHVLDSPIVSDGEYDALTRLAAAASAYAEHPALLRVRELETLGALGANAEARLYIGFEKHSDRLPGG